MGDFYRERHVGVSRFGWAGRWPAIPSCVGAVSGKPGFSLSKNLRRSWQKTAPIGKFELFRLAC